MGLQESEINNMNRLYAEWKRILIKQIGLEMFLHEFASAKCFVRGDSDLYYKGFLKEFNFTDNDMAFDAYITGDSLALIEIGIKNGDYKK